MIQIIIALVIAIAADVAATELTKTFPGIARWLPFVDVAVYVVAAVFLATCVIRIIKAIRND